MFMQQDSGAIAAKTSYTSAQNLWSDLPLFTGGRVHCRTAGGLA